MNWVTLQNTKLERASLPALQNASLHPDQENIITLYYPIFEGINFCKN